MAVCKLCGRVVLCAPVFHPECWQKYTAEQAHQFCSSYCRWPDECRTVDELRAQHCSDCPMTRLMERS